MLIYVFPLFDRDITENVVVATLNLLKPDASLWTQAVDSENGTSPPAKLLVLCAFLSTNVVCTHFNKPEVS